METKTTWTKFFDMSSGGSEKTDYAIIFIELPEKEAIEYFEKKFERNPHNVTCSCCGEDFSVYEIEPNYFDRDRKDVLIISKKEIETND